MTALLRQAASARIAFDPALYAVSVSSDEFLAFVELVDLGVGVAGFDGFEDRLGEGVTGAGLDEAEELELVGGVGRAGQSGEAGESFAGVGDERVEEVWGAPRNPDSGSGYDSLKGTWRLWDQSERSSPRRSRMKR